MHVSRLKIEGFKGSPASFEFGRRVLIHGPNGSGKTRILDAIRFALGHETAGVSPDGKNLASAMKGERISSEIVLEGEGNATTIKRQRSRRTSGTFSRSKVFVDGREVPDLSEIVRAEGPQRGRDLVHMSPEALLLLVSKIGAMTSPSAEALVSSLEDALRSISPKWSPLKSSPAVDRLQAALENVARWKKEARSALKEATASQDRSRRELGTERVEPGRSDLLSKKAREAAESERKVSEEIGSFRSDVARASRRISALQAKLEAADNVERGEPIVALEENRGRLEAELKEAEADLQSAEESAREAAQSHANLERSIGGLEDRISQARIGISEAKRAKDLLDAAPCSRASDWASLQALEEDPFAEPADLCSACLFTDSARENARNLKELEEALDELLPKAEKASELWKSATSKRVASSEALEAAKRRRIEIVKALDTLSVERSKIERLAGLGPEGRSGLLGEIAELERERATAEEGLRRAAAGLETHSAEKVRLSSEAREASVLEERLRRLRSDERRASEAEDRLRLCSQLEEQARRISRVLSESGQARILEIGAPLVVKPWTLTFDEDGRVGLRGPRGDFWTGVGLSAAQFELIASALDLALSVIHGANFRVAMIEADPLDANAREALLYQLEEALERGDLDQAFVSSWLPVDEVGLGAVEDWTRIEIGREEEVEDDPFSTPPYVAEVESADGARLSTILEAIKARRPGAFQKTPRRIDARRLLILELLEEIEDGERKEILAC